MVVKDPIEFIEHDAGRISGHLLLCLLNPVARNLIVRIIHKGAEPPQFKQLAAIVRFASIEIACKKLREAADGAHRLLFANSMNDDDGSFAHLISPPPLTRQIVPCANDQVPDG
jgi:hypothetical protein